MQQLQRCRVVTLNREVGGLNFLNPGASEGGSNKAGETIDNHFTKVQCHCKPHSSPLPLCVCVLCPLMCACVQEGGEVMEGKKKGEDRYHIPARARSGWSLSCAPLEACWTKHRPDNSLRTLLL